MKKSFIILLQCISLSLAAQTPSLPSGEIYQNIKKLNVLGSVLYLAAHPDDENTLMLAYLSKDQLVRTGYLSLTRGDGGQNLIGSEQGYNIGVIRTQELLGARRTDGAQQFFSRAYDFGFSKTREETLNFWDEDKVLGDVVWMIRKFRPDVIITRFPPDPRAGHGHHQTSAYLAEKAFSLAADPKSYADQLKFVKPWQARRLVWNTYTPGFTNQPPADEKASFLGVEIGGYNAVLGKSYPEIAAESRSQHKSQAFGTAPVRGERKDYFLHKMGTAARQSLFDDVDMTWKRVKGSAKVQGLVSQAISTYNVQKPEASMDILLKINQELARLDTTDIYVKTKKSEVQDLILQCAGLWFETNPTDFSSVPGMVTPVRISVVKRSDYPVRLKALHWTGAEADSVINAVLAPNTMFTAALQPKLPETIAVSQPYWLKKPITRGMFDIGSQQDIGFPENRPETITRFTFEIGGQTLTFDRAWIYKSTDPAEGEIYRPFEIRPPVTATLTEPVFIFPDQNPKTVTVIVQAQKTRTVGTVRLDLPTGWKSEPASADFDIPEKYHDQYFYFKVTPPAASDEATLKVATRVDGKDYYQSIKTIAHRHIPTQTIFPPAEARIARLDVKTAVKKIGYIAGAGDEVPAALRQMNCDVTMLGEAALAGDLADYEAIILGVRAYNTWERLANYQDKLMEYVKNGGTMIVQYNVPGGMKVNQVGPFAMNIGRDRVAEENAEARFLLPDHSLLNFPNRITEKDFTGWIQERGLYFAENWDKAHYQAPLSMNDKNESPKDGSLLYCQYGKGHYIFTGLSFFRELPAGVTGAYRLFANLISAGKAK
ncbi:PIG-L family deacetylase [Dyadobacter sandarakinus]|uniref:PIG-L family deacetylase n=1 Tax=Dyadobacter sandarakinus TaxID=2747268 RepID=A0ABX7ICX5_9BACT|nr:PIG-L family deacetylase [Dyadobacter sandarakinus]QRR03962.1 PIG-L family deacetylase [Dyadobacter sandarakinus]